VSHFCKLDQQRKVTSENEGSRPFKYTRNKEGAESFDTARKQVHNIDFDGCGLLENWDKNFRPLRQENENRVYDSRKDHQQNRGGYPSRDRGRGRFQENLCIACFMRKILIIRQGIVFLESKKRMAQKQNHPLASSTAKEVNHTSHWHQPSQSSSSNQPSHHNFRPRSEYQPNHHRYPSQYYQSYNFMPHTSQI
jgi:hypothetical protein